MVRKHVNKRTFVIAAMVILLCLVSLVGATLALFTGEGGKIGIVTTTGSVKVDIVDTSEKAESLVGEVLNFQTSSSNKKIYFEPGATYYTQGFRIKNEGDISITYRLSLSTDKVENREQFEQGFELLVSTKPTGEDAIELNKFSANLKADEISETYYLIVKMKTTVGNDFQGKAYSGIGVTVYAVQSNGAFN
ncbi:MAG: hypothetical protein IKC48_03815 [Clostridia bacterium]|nr:hypothetical protein [Clostridia bacterium]